MAHPPRHVTYTPDYQALIQQDPAFAALQQQLSAQGISDASQRQAATEQALIQFGMVPDFANNELGLSPQALAMLQHDIDPHAAQLARANTAAGLSTEAGLQQGQEQAIHSLRNALAAHGALSSGDDAYRTNLQDQSYAKAQSDALSQLLASIGGYQQQFTTGEQARQQQLQAGLETAQQFESGLPQNQGFQLNYDVQHGVYRDASGNAYTPHRNPDGSWQLTNSATGAVYTLGSDGTVTSGGSPPGDGGGHPANGPANGHAPTYGPNASHPFGPHVRPADAFHARGMDDLAARTWIQHHPGALAHKHFGYVPDWVRGYLPGVHPGVPPHSPPPATTPGAPPPWMPQPPISVTGGTPPQAPPWHPPSLTGPRGPVDATVPWAPPIGEPGGVPGPVTGHPWLAPHFPPLPKPVV